MSEIPNPTSVNLYEDDPDTGTHCCITCKTELKRTYIPFFKKYVIAAACKCSVQKMEQEELERERKLRRSYMDKIYNKSIMSDALKLARFDNFISREGSQIVFKASKEFAS